MAGKKAGELKKDGTPAIKPGAPEHVPTDGTRKQAEYLAGLGVPHEHIAVIVGLSDDKTLRKHYEHELKMGKAMANFKATEILFGKVQGGDLGATIFWLKAQAGWREKQEVVHTGPDGGPIGAEAVNAVMDNFLGALFGGARTQAPLITAEPIDVEVVKVKKSKKGDDE